MNRDIATNASLRIAIDAVFFRFLVPTSGIARYWQSILKIWANEPFSNSVLVLDRDGTWEKIYGIASVRIPPFTEDREADSHMLQAVCDQFDIDLIISTYYTFPRYTPSMLMAYDMIPERTNWDLRQVMWQNKHRGIRHATSAIAISRNTAEDLAYFFPQFPIEKTIVAYPAAGPNFQAASIDDVREFRKRFGISQNYFLTVGARDGYKNVIQLFRALSTMPERNEYEIVCIGGEATMSSEMLEATNQLNVRMLPSVSDQELRAAYTGAMALVYPSLYEGFGIPPLEAMSCGCPVVTTRCGSLEEVCGPAAIYVAPDSVSDMVDGLRRTFDEEVRHRAVTMGFERAKLFDWKLTAETVKNAILGEALRLKTDESALLLRDARMLAERSQKENRTESLVDSWSHVQDRCSELVQATPTEHLESAYRGELGKSIRSIIACRDFIGQSIHESKPHGIVSTPHTPRDWIVASILSILYGTRDATITPDKVPDWLLEDFVTYLVRSPILYVDAECRKEQAIALENWLGHVLDRVEHNDPVWNNLLERMLGAMDLLTLLASGHAPTQILRLRGKLVEHFLRRQGQALAWDFAQPEKRTRTKVGVLLGTLASDFSTWVKLEKLKTFDRSKVELVAYVRETLDTSEEAECRLYVEQLVRLPPMLTDAVNLIRRDEFDIFLVDLDIASRVTPMTLLAAHRLGGKQFSLHTLSEQTGLISFDDDEELRTGTSLAGISGVASDIKNESCLATLGVKIRQGSARIKIDRKALGISESEFVYGSGASVHKYSPETREAFAKILSEQPQSILLLYPFTPGWTNATPLHELSELFKATFRKFGVDTNRLKIVTIVTNRREHYELTGLCDAYLDTFPQPGFASIISAKEAKIPIFGRSPLVL